MKRVSTIPMWLYATVALAIALGAFAIGQVWPGRGMPFVAVATGLWVAWSASRQRKLAKGGE